VSFCGLDYWRVCTSILPTPVMVKSHTKETAAANMYTLASKAVPVLPVAKTNDDGSRSQMHLYPLVTAAW